MVCLTCRRDSTRLKSGNCRFLENSVKAQDRWKLGSDRILPSLVSFHRHHSYFSVIILAFDWQHTSTSLTMRPRSSVAQAPVDNGKKPRRPPKKRARGSDVDGNQQTVEVVKSGAKKAKWQPRPGKLAALMNLPLDVLFEVCPFCHGRYCLVFKNASGLWPPKSFRYTSPGSHNERI
jgi:hypothetical protein